MLRSALGFLLVVHALAAVAQTPPVKDHPLVSRFQGSEVLDYKAAEFDEFLLPLGSIIDETHFTKSERLEGKITKFRYSVPANRSALEVFRSYEDALRRGGFQILFTCAGTECRSDKYKGGYSTAASGVWCFTCEEPMHYLAAKLTRPGREAYVSLVVDKDRWEGGAYLAIVEPKAMSGGLVTVNAAAMANDIAQTGHATIYGIYFDSGKSAVKPESDPTLAQISKLLDAHPQLKLHVVGHTDNVGQLGANMTLSKQRAEAVVAALVTRYRVAASRLRADGVGPLAPVDTNHTEDGRAKNRRVELVEQ